MRVLVYDDDAAIGRLIVRIGTIAETEVVAVTEPDAFAQSLQADPPDVVMLDLQLGETDGVQQLRFLADQRYAGSLVLMSGFDARVLDTARSLGCSLGLKVHGVLEKPLRVAEVEQMLQKLSCANRPMSLKQLMHAISNDDLALDFQPIVVRRPNELKKLEALIRWDHPVRGRILPSEFLPLAESDTAAIDALTDWVVRAAVEAYDVLKSLGITVPLSVNISPSNLHDLKLPDRIAQCLQEGGMPFEHLCLEITESAAFKHASRTMDILSRLRLKGICLSIDDFGTGHSSLKLLLQMPFSEIKIDQSFTSDVTTSRDSRAIVKSIVDLATNMEMACVVEGIETEAIANLVEQLGASHLQGYFIARPMPVEAIHPWLMAWKDSQTAAMSPVPSAPVKSGNDKTTLQQPDASSRAETASAAAQLPPRQLEVIQLLSEGASVKEIARRLNISPGTVKVHLSLAYATLGARNRIEAVIRAGLTPRPQSA